VFAFHALVDLLYYSKAFLFFDEVRVVVFVHFPHFGHVYFLLDLGLGAVLGAEG
jgi:hypothetical protein